MRDRAGGSVLRALTRPPAHRGPLIAAGAVVLTVGIALEEIRLAQAIGPAAHLLILAVATAAILGLGLQARTEDGRPPAYQSVLLVTGLLLLGGSRAATRRPARSCGPRWCSRAPPGGSR
jgi:hypothetical protein